MNQYETGAVLFTTNLKSLANFYERVMGMKVTKTEDDHIRLELGSFRLTVHAIPKHYAKNVVIKTPTPITHFLNVPDAPWAEIARQAAVEAHKPVADAQAYVLSRPYWETELWDGIHPTHELQQAIAHNVTAPALAPIIAKMLCR